MAKHAMTKLLLAVNENPVGQPATTTLTFAAAAEQWLKDCETRDLDRVKPSTIVTWKNILANHLNPKIGELPLVEVENGTLRSVVKQLHHTRLDQKLSPATVHNVLTVAKMVVASAVDKNGNALFPRTWNRIFIGAARVEPEDQKTPCFTTDEVSQIVTTATGRVQMLCILLAASGIRIGEALGLECKHFDGSSVHVMQTVWGHRGDVQKPKTKAGDRHVDLHPDVASLLKVFIGDRKSGYVFPTTSSNKPLTETNILRRGLHPLLDELGIPRCGFHAFRRYRVTHLRQKGCGDMLLKIWMGHKAKGMSELYDKTKRDLVYRQMGAQSLGTGFDVPKALTAKQKKSALLGANAQLVSAETPINVG
jgi:integrase